METQNKQIRNYLLEGGQLTPLDALYKFGCFRLSARIHDLRKEGMAIDSEVTQITSSGKKKHVTRYFCKQ